MAQNQNIGLFGQYLTVNTTANSVFLANTATFYNLNGQANIAAGAFVGNAYATLGGASGNYLAFGQQTSSAQWIQSGYSSAGAPVYYSILLNPLGGNIGIGNTAPIDRLSVNGNTYLQGTATVTGNSTVVNVYSTGTVNAVAYNTGAPLTGTGGITANVTTIVVGNNTINTSITSAGLTVNGTAVVANSSGIFSTGTINAASHTVGTSFIANSTQLTTTYPTVHTANVTVNGAIIANATSGTAGQVLTSAGTGNVYWSTVSGGGGGFTNGQSISVSNLAITGTVNVGSSVGTSGQILISTGTGVQWSTPGTTYSYSSLFNGSTQYLSVSSNSALNLTADFTVECWAYATTTTNSVDQVFSYGNFTFMFYHNGTTWTVEIGNGTSNYFTLSGTASLNTWHHFAITRSTNTYTFWIDGVSVATATNSNAPATNVALYIGVNPSSITQKFTGYISNFRIVKGVAVYTGAFTPPNTLLSATQVAGTNIAAISGVQTSILTCQTQSINDASTYNFQITNTGGVTTTTNIPFPATNVTVPTTSFTSVRQSFTGDGSTTSFTIAGGYTANAIDVYVNGLRFRNGSDVTVTSGTAIVFAIAPPNGALIDVVATIPTTYTTIATSGFGAYFNGSSNISVAANAALSFGTGDFTIEMWVYPTAAITGNEIVYGYRSGSDTSPYLMLNPTYGVIFGGDVTDFLRSSVAPVLNTWTHIAVTRSGTSLKMFMNGAQVVSATNSTNFSDASIRYIGAGASLQYPFIGYISNLRVVKGTAIYTTAFTTPSSPLTAVSGTSLLTLNSSTIVDNGPNALSLTNNGATVSSSVAPVFTTYTVNQSSGSGGLSLALVQTANLTASAGYIYPINTSNGPVYVTLPASPTSGQQIAITDYAGTFGSNNCIINPNGNKISGLTSNTILAVNREGASIVYVDSTQGWLGYGNFIPNPVGSYAIEVLIVAGGGGGGIHSGGGGGAGGLLYYGSETPKTPSGGLITVNPGNSYSLVVGAGGASSGGPYTSVTGSGGDGGSSSAFGYTAIGGGGGGSGGNSIVGRNGGSGGGGGRNIAAGSGTSGQGFAGGSPGTSQTTPNYPGGGGGGASAVGTGGNANQGGNGGDGLAYVISGASTYYGGGGGGNLQDVATVQGTGGLGGGGAGTSGAGVAGTVNTGGGGGGANYNSAGGGAGGSGIIIIRYLGSQRGNGGNNITSSGGYTIHKFTSSGTFIA